jgi:hypothetical protein
MPEAYNPFVRTFCRFRAVLLERLDLDRRAVRPGTPLEAIIPVWARRDVWDHLRRRGLDLPALHLSERDCRRNVLSVSMVTLSLAILLQSWWALLLVLPLSVAVYRASRRRAVHFPHPLTTVGELVFYATRFGDHKDSGYRWTRDEIALKVRMIVADSTGYSLEEIRPETRLKDLA